MTQMTSTGIRTLDRAPMVDDIVIIAPKSETLFDVIALDEPGTTDPRIYVRRHVAGDDAPPARWVFLTYVKVVDDEDPRAYEG